VVLRWINTDSSQTGVRVYRGGRRIASLSGGARSYTDAFFHHAWHGDDDITYGVQAFNNYALSSIVTVDLEHCH
jgi:hypothetical protein